MSWRCMGFGDSGILISAVDRVSGEHDALASLSPRKQYPVANGQEEDPV
jgi:hypothetical protein